MIVWQSTEKGSSINFDHTRELVHDKKNHCSVEKFMKYSETSFFIHGRVYKTVRHNNAYRWRATHHNAQQELFSSEELFNAVTFKYNNLRQNTIFILSD